MSRDVIHIKGARQHNLKNIDVDLPLNNITVITGVSGSGKSSLAMDTLYAEGQRRYVETFSPYARQFMERMDRPEVDSIEGIPPAIAIESNSSVRTSRSTVGTMTEITDYAKLLYTRLGQLRCSRCGEPVKPETPEHVWNLLEEVPRGTEVVITFTVSLKPDSIQTIKAELIRMGFYRFFLEWRIRSLEELNREAGELYVVADRLRFSHSERKRVFDSLEQAFRMGGGRLHIWIKPDRHLTFSNRLECPKCKISYREPMPNLFSFNSPVGACSECKGFGRIIDFDPGLVIPNKNLSIQEGAVKPWGNLERHHMEFRELLDFCEQKDIPTDMPFKDLKESQKEAIIEGDETFYGIRGFFEWLETKKYKMHVRVFLSRYRAYRICPACKGARFKKEALLYTISGLNIARLYSLTIEKAHGLLESIHVPPEDKAGKMILNEIKTRLSYLLDVGLGYLTLDRQSRTLSSGEVQRVALTSALGSSLANSLYILDEPSVGLHPRDNHRLIDIIKKLKAVRNTVVVVEHDPEIIRQSDYLLDMGPGAGKKGGEITYFGPTSRVSGSLTGQYLKGEKFIPAPSRPRTPGKSWVTLEGAREHNLKDIAVHIPVGLFVCLTGVSGSGKSTLAEDILFKGIKRIKSAFQGIPGSHRTIKGLDLISDVVMIDQKPIGRSPRANSLTYVKAMDHVRHLLSKTEGAVSRGLGPSHFSFNVAGGRCENCKGQGSEKIEMQFLSDVFVTCPDCHGQRFKKEILEVTYRNRNIHDIMTMTVDQALSFFSDQQRIRSALQPLADVGLGYIQLGQPINTLSGGEAQRLKLSRYLKSSAKGPVLFILDEPSTGLHFADIEKLLSLLQALADQGNTVLVIEHNMDIVKNGDWVIDLGPEGGEEGGRVVASGTPGDIAMNPDSHTGKFLKKYLRGFQNIDPHSDQGISQEGSDMPEAISLVGAREHNLKNMDLSIPRKKFVVLTGVSGSGKSTLAFDILFAEGQRRYLECFAPYARQYVNVLERSEVDVVTGLPPTVAIRQRIQYARSKTTVATLTEIYHFLRLLYSKLGSQRCPVCGRKMIAQSRELISERVRERYGWEKGLVLAPLITGRKGFHKDLLELAIKRGYREFRIDGEFVRLRESCSLSRYKEHTIEAVLGKVPDPDPDELVSKALSEGNGTFIIMDSQGKEEVFSVKKVCPNCGTGARELDPRLFSFNSKYGACPVCRGFGFLEGRDNGNTVPCPGCGCARLKKEALSVDVKGYSIWDLVRFSGEKLRSAVKEFSFTEQESPIADPIIGEIITRLHFMDLLGISYLSLSRSGDTLSGGEAQRIRLAAQLGSNLTGVCYILDEPTIGLHPRDNRMLLKALRDLKNRGNSILVVEHDEETIREADHIIDLGPGAGDKGGRVVARGEVHDIKKVPESVTGLVLSRDNHRITSRLRPYREYSSIKLLGASEHNLKNLDVEFPLGTLICITGVSGSGKSTLLKDVLYRGLNSRLSKKEEESFSCRSIEGWQKLDRVLEVDHSPIGLTTRSVPVSYIGILSEIRNLFSGTPEARARGYRPGRFSFNLPGGRCEACKGHGYIKAEMNFLPGVLITCEACKGNRFNRETLGVTYKGKNMAEVLGLTLEEAASFFSAVPRIKRAIRVVCETGLGYLRLGQPSPTLSGGEAQRIKIARELARRPKGHCLYIMDEPTTGLHIADISALVRVLQALVDKGNTVAVIEHNMEIIKEADYIVDLGPEAGERGGQVVAAGSPVEILQHAGKSHTSEYLNRYLLF